MPGLHRLLACAAALLISSVAQAQQYPDHPLQVLVANGPGSASDVSARIVLAKMAASLGQPAVIINKPGAGGIIAAQTIAKAAPDGYTLLVATDSTYTAVPLSNKMAGYDLKSATTLGGIADIPSVLLVSSTLNVRTLDEFVAYAKARPGQLNYSMFEKGSLPQLWLDWFLNRLGLKIQHLPYKSGPELVTAAATGDAAITISSLTSSQGYIDSGRLVPVVLTNPSLKSRFPGVPMVSDIVPDAIDPTSSIMLFGPPALPSNVLNVLNRELLKAQSSPDVQEGLRKIGLVSPTVGSPDEEARRMERKLSQHAVLVDGNR